MSRRATTPMRVAARSLRQLCAFAALVAAVAVVVLPALHGAHAPPLASAVAAADVSLPAFGAHAHVEATACDLCAAVGQARSAIAAPAASLPVLQSVSARPVPARADAALALAAASPFAPRAPPARI